MSFKDAINRAEMQCSHEFKKYWDSFFKMQIKEFALETTNQEVLEAYHQMINGRNTDFFFTENNYINK